MIVSKVKTMMLELCKDKDFDWAKHITSVAKYSKILAEKLHADAEVCELSAWLHDIIKIRDGVRDLHHVKGSEEAAKILAPYNYPTEKIEKVKHCILTHSSDKNYPPLSVEAKIVAASDALSHLDNFIDLAYVAFNLKKYGITEGKGWLNKKYDACWDKIRILPEAAEIGEERYKAIRLIIS
ncbi:MAG: HD domain-containing protein [archaeon]